MAGRYKAYPEYKDSGITWTGKVPSHWTLVRFKHVLAEKKKTSNPSLPAGSISFGEVVYKNDETISPETKASYQEVLKGEFLVNPLNMNYDLLSLRTALSSIDVVVSTGYIVLRSNARLNPRYARWLLQEFDVAHMKTLGSGVRQTINYTDIGNSFFFEVPLPEQKQIAKFLDHETGKIDLLIEKQQALIALLKEKRQAVISHAVTKGLNPDAKMKDSGVEWLGEVPEHWTVAGLKKYLNRIVDYRGKTPTKVDRGVFLVTARNIKNGRIDYDASKEYIPNSEYENVMSRGKPKVGDLLFTTEAPLGEVAQIDREDIALAQRIVKFRAQPRYLKNDYLKYLIQSDQFQYSLSMYATGSTAPGIKAERFVYLRILLPPLGEQANIVRHIEEVKAKLDSLQECADQQANILKERRTALISAAVTGKIDVRDWTAHEEKHAERNSA